jgi:hypothetical protein
LNDPTVTYNNYLISAPVVILKRCINVAALVASGVIAMRKLFAALGACALMAALSGSAHAAFVISSAPGPFSGGATNTQGDITFDGLPTLNLYAEAVPAGFESAGFPKG